MRDDDSSVIPCTIDALMGVSLNPFNDSERSVKVNIVIKS